MPSIYGAAWRLLHNEQDAADLVQETYLRAFRTFPSFRPGTNCKAWLFTILYSIFINRYHQQRRRPSLVALDELGDTVADPSAPVEFARLLDDRTIQWEDAEVSAALKQLPDEFRLTVLLVDVEGLTYEEAAASLQCPVGTVRSRLARARRALFESLREYARERGLLPRERRAGSD
ncbi:MAG: sigma-70 family RNA polymerase sigma factor [Acidobacteriales bacterium]|nr:sigma-70 family RNA polymerase sigma factor [Terriglobales bacterium]MCI0622122.1 sigma-70 family RNA polymerase sigma factor [Acidobacteriota bacterium]MCI0719005.1 sigma-70 family RNA polymerase sigma factor [Acidobacteriota bacterium]